MNKNTKTLFSAISYKNETVAVKLLNQEDPWYVSACIGFITTLNVLIFSVVSLATFPIAFPFIYFFANNIAHLVTWPSRVLTTEVDLDARINGMTTLQMAAKSGLRNTVCGHYGQGTKSLTTPDVLDHNDAGLTALHLAILYNQIDVIKSLFMTSPAVLSASGESALGLAVRIGNAHAVKALLTYGNGTERFGVKEALCSSHCENLDYMTPLEVAIIKQDLTILDLLLPHVSEPMINQLDTRYRTPLSVAVLEPKAISIAAVGRLLDKDADPIAKVANCSGKKDFLLMHLSNQLATDSIDKSSIAKSIQLLSTAFSKRLLNTG